MAGKFIIEVYREKNTDELTKLIADPESKLGTGSGAAATAAYALAYLARAAALTEKAGVTGERIEYIARNAETIRNYMVFLIDEDIKSKNPMRMALKKGEEKGIEAARHPAVEIPMEIINMMGKAMELANELADMCCEEAEPFIAQFAYTAMSVIQTSISSILSITGDSIDETYRFVSHRENEITLGIQTELYNKIMEKLS